MRIPILQQRKQIHRQCPLSKHRHQEQPGHGRAELRCSGPSWNEKGAEDQDLHTAVLGLGAGLGPSDLRPCGPFWRSWTLPDP